MAGTVGAIFNGALQLGSAIGISAVGSIEASVNRTHGRASYAGRAAAFWFLLGIVGVEFVAMLVFYRIGREGGAAEALASKAKSLEEVEEVVVEKDLKVADGELEQDAERRGSTSAEEREVEAHTTVRELPVSAKGDLNV